MTLLELVKKASEHYDGGLEPYYDERTGEPRYDPEGGDTLAFFVVCELASTFDPDAVGEDQEMQIYSALIGASEQLSEMASKISLS